MSKNNLWALIIILVALVGVVFLVSGTQIRGAESDLQTSQSVTPAEKIEVVHFHGTQQCWSCITVGEYALFTIKNKFSKEYTSGKIIFKDIDGELPKNQAIVMKYQARGSSLFVNSIYDGQDHIKEEVNVWRLVNDKTAFVNYFQEKLQQLLGN